MEEKDMGGMMLRQHVRMTGRKRKSIKRKERDTPNGEECDYKGNCISFRCVEGICVEKGPWWKQPPDPERV